MYFVGSNSDLYSAWVSVVMYVISYYIGPSNGTPLYFTWKYFVNHVGPTLYLVNECENFSTVLIQFVNDAE